MFVRFVCHYDPLWHYGYIGMINYCIPKYESKHVKLVPISAGTTPFEACSKDLRQVKDVCWALKTSPPAGPWLYCSCRAAAEIPRDIAMFRGAVEGFRLWNCMMPAARWRVCTGGTRWNWNWSLAIRHHLRSIECCVHAVLWVGHDWSRLMCRLTTTQRRSLFLCSWPTLCLSLKKGVEMKLTCITLGVIWIDQLTSHSFWQFGSCRTPSVAK